MSQPEVDMEWKCGGWWWYGYFESLERLNIVMHIVRSGTTSMGPA